MKKNVGIKEANIRTLVAAVLILLVFFFVKNPYIQIISALISAVLAGTAFLRTCPVYHYLHKNTCGDTCGEDRSHQSATPQPQASPSEDSA